MFTLHVTYDPVIVGDLLAGSYGGDDIPQLQDNPGIGLTTLHYTTHHGDLAAGKQKHQILIKNICNDKSCDKLSIHFLQRTKNAHQYTMQDVDNFYGFSRNIFLKIK